MKHFPEIEAEINRLRREKEIYIAVLCKELNEARDSIKWKPSVLKDYINEMFETTGGLASLNFEHLEVVTADLKKRLEILREK
jgi:hypothetical protein